MTLGDGVHSFSSHVLTERFNQYLTTKSVSIVGIRTIGRICRRGTNCWFNVAQKGFTDVEGNKIRAYVFYINEHTKSRMNEDLSSYIEGL